jgi:hypothetical protein
MTAWLDIKQSQSARVRELDAWWRGNSRERLLPDRSDLDPAAIPLLLPYILISEIEQPFRVRYRLIGTEVVHVTGLNFTGHYLDQLIPPGEEESWLAHYRHCFETARPIYGLSTVKTLAGGSFSYEYGIWPLTKGGSEVSQFIALEDYGPHRARARELLDQAKLWRRAEPAAAD